MDNYELIYVLFVCLFKVASDQKNRKIREFSEALISVMEIRKNFSEFNKSLG